MNLRLADERQVLAAVDVVPRVAAARHCAHAGAVRVAEDGRLVARVPVGVREVLGQGGPSERCDAISAGGPEADVVINVAACRFQFQNVKVIFYIFLYIGLPEPRIWGR